MKHISFCVFFSALIAYRYVVVLYVYLCFILNCILMPEVGVRVHDEAHGEDLCAHLHRVDARENWLQLLLII